MLSNIFSKNIYIFQKQKKNEKTGIVLHFATLFNVWLNV